MGSKRGSLPPKEGDLTCMIQRNLTGSKISRSSTKFVFLGLIGKTRWPPWPLIGETFLTSPLKPLNRIQRNLTASKISMCSTKFVFFGPIGKTRLPPWPLIGWDIFDFSSETAKQNSTKLDRKKDLNVLCQVCLFWADQKNKKGRPGQFLLKVARYTQVHDMWPFGPHVIRSALGLIQGKARRSQRELQRQKALLGMLPFW